jgi:hypothetical protein
MTKQINRELTTKQAKYIQGRLTGKSRSQAVLDAGYNTKNPAEMASQVEHNKHIREALKKYGLTAESIAQDLKTHVQLGLKVKNTADTSLKALSIISDMYGYTNNRDDIKNTNNTQINNYYHSLDNDNLLIELKNIQDSISKLK